VAIGSICSPAYEAPVAIGFHLLVSIRGIGGDRFHLLASIRGTGGDRLPSARQHTRHRWRWVPSARQHTRHSLAVVTLLSSMNTLTLTATDDGTRMLLGSLKASFGPNGLPTVVSVGGTHAMDAVVLVLVVVVVVGHRPLPGWQSGTSDCAGHGLPPKDFCRVTVRDLSAPCSHTCVHALNT
jgi:hypothetical protein